MKYLVTIKFSDMFNHDVIEERFLANTLDQVNVFLEASAFRVLTVGELHELRESEIVTGFEWYEQMHERTVEVARGNFLVVTEVK